MLLHKIMNQSTHKLMDIFAKPISGWIRVQKLLQGISEQRFLKLTSHKKNGYYSYSLYAFEMLKSVANTISKLMSRVISEIIITRAFGTRVIISDITLLFVC